LDPAHYHQLTKHAPDVLRIKTRYIDWSSQPNPFKEYLEIEGLGLPDPAPDTGFPTALAITEGLGAPRPLDGAEVARLLSLSAGVHRVLEIPNRPPIYFRTYACAGALYPIELYLASGGGEDLPPGLYHYHPLQGALRLLRDEDPRPWLVRASGRQHAVTEAPVSVILTGIPWRTTWKYEARGYRHLWWDAGMVLANLLALAASGGHQSQVVIGFDDDEVATLLGVDVEREMPICIVPIGYGQTGQHPVEPAVSPPEPRLNPAAPLSKFEKTYGEILEVHRSSKLAGSVAVQAWRIPRVESRSPDPGPLCSGFGIEKVIRRRGSRRVFEHHSIGADQLEGIIAHATNRLSCDWGGDLVQIGLIANAVDGLESGSYSCVGGTEQLTEGDLRKKASFLCLDQPLGGDAAATLFLMADLEHTTSILGNRGYRAAQLEAGIVAGRLYLGAYECRLGATGLTFFDDEVRAFFETEAEPMLVVAIGR
jgi:SagB-type dehydrogenase family enzyme